MIDTWEIKQHVNQSIQAETKQQDILVQVISIITVTGNAAQVNSQKLD